MYIIDSTTKETISIRGNNRIWLYLFFRSYEKRERLRDYFV